MSRSKGAGPREAGRRILVVDDAEGIRTYLANLLELRGYAVDTAEDGRRALALLEAGADPDVILLDVMMPGMDGLETLRRMHERDPALNVVMLSVVGRAQTIVEAMQLGAIDYLNKPFEEEELDLVLRGALEKRDLERERERLIGEAGYDPDSAIWLSPAMRRTREVIDQVSDTDVTVLIQGESGVGKEIVARAVHRYSTRSDRPFVKVNCAALPADLLESELFGYEKGAFTGAVGRKPGKFEVADGGTMFLDEIGEMSPPLQAKLLQVLQDGVFTRLGGNRDVRVDVRVVCATNRELEAMVEAGGFREDLFFRLNVVSLQIPPLRERREEVPALVAAFLRALQRALSQAAPPALAAAPARVRSPSVPGQRPRAREHDQAHRRARQRGVGAEGAARAERTPERAARSRRSSRSSSRPRAICPCARSARAPRSRRSARRSSACCSRPSGTASRPPGCWASATRRCSRRSGSAGSSPRSEPGSRGPSARGGVRALTSAAMGLVAARHRGAPPAPG